jgi:Phosphoglycerate dehydrogenase and related dehydrogenases
MKVTIYSEHWNQFWSLPEHFVDALRADFPQIEFMRTRTDSELGELLQETEIYFGYRFLPGDIHRAKNLKWIHVPAASVFPLKDLGLTERGIIVTNSRGLHAIPIAEHVIGCMLVFSRKFMDCWKFQQNRHYGAREILNDPPLPTELRGKTVFILGAGGIGKEVARLCKAFGMRVLASKKHVEGDVANIDKIFTPQNFREALPEADYVVISVPRTAETDDLIGTAEIAMLKNSCILINIARAKIIQQDALIDALKENRIRGAALDVFEQEPLPSDSVLYTLPNVFLTPHTSGVSAEEHWPRMMDLFKDNLRRYLAKETLLNVVNLRDGY